MNIFHWLAPSFVVGITIFVVNALALSQVKTYADEPAYHMYEGLQVKAISLVKSRNLNIDVKVSISANGLEQIVCKRVSEHLGGPLEVDTTYTCVVEKSTDGQRLKAPVLKAGYPL